MTHALRGLWEISASAHASTEIVGYFNGGGKNYHKGVKFYQECNTLVCESSVIQAEYEHCVCAVGYYPQFLPVLNLH